MTTSLQDSCHELGEVLSRVLDGCEIILADLGRFDSYVGRYAVGRLVRRLAILSFWISAVAESLYRDHVGQGYVCVVLKEGTGIFIHRVEREELLPTRWTRAHGYTVLSVDGAVGIIEELARELDSGNWAKVVDWLNRYGKSPGLDFGSFPETHTTVNT